MKKSLPINFNFYFSQGEPWQRKSYSFQEKEKPYSLYMAIVTMSDEQWCDIAEKHFKCEPDNLSLESVFNLTCITNICEETDEFFKVFIDPKLNYFVKIWKNINIVML